MEKKDYLRLKTEVLLHTGETIGKSVYEKDLESLVEDLNVYQIELEHQNISLQRAQQEEVRLKERYLDLFENAPIGYFIMDRKFKILDLNKTACRLLGEEFLAIKGLSFTRFIHFDYQDFFYLDFRDLITGATKNAVHSDIKLKTPSEQELFIRLVGIPEAISHEEQAFRVAMMDVTVEKSLEIVLKQETEKAKESDRLKSAFLANMSHEIRTPLNAILGFAALLNEENLDPSLIKEYASIISKGGIRLLGLINNILDISKIESQNMPTAISFFSPYRLIEETIDLFRIQQQSQNVQIIHTSQGVDDELSIHSDLLKCSHILSNLLSNAIKYSKNGIVKIGFKIENDEAVFYVKDNGIGIPDKEKPYIFERFYRINEGEHRHFDGTGLGLYLCQKLADLMGCVITFDSIYGEGSEFRLVIPYSKKAAVSVESEDADKELKRPTHCTTILIAEDDHFNAQLLSIICHSSGFNTIVVENGEEAVKAVQDHPFIAMVLMDIKMPLVDGYEATRRIRRFNKQIPIVAVTAFALDGDKDKAIEAGCNDYLSKPISIDIMKLTFAKYLNYKG